MFDFGRSKKETPYDERQELGQFYEGWNMWDFENESRLEDLYRKIEGVSGF